jgi:mRNA interferase MazF
MKRGEVWWVDLNPTRGGEMAKVRLAVVLSRDDVGVLPLRVVVPLTAWQDHFQGVPWLVRLDPAASNGIRKPSAADTFQVRSVSTQRFSTRAGMLPPADLEAVTQALVRVVGGGP